MRGRRLWKRWVGLRDEAAKLAVTLKVLGSPITNSESGTSQVEPNPNKTRNNRIPITKPNYVPQVTWSDIARKEPIRKNDTTIARPHDSSGWRGVSRRYDTRLAGLTG